MLTLNQYYLRSIFPIKKEYVGLILALLAFIFFPNLSRQIDVTSAALDPGALSAIIMAVLAILVFKAVTWWIINSIWPVLGEYSRISFESNFNSLPAWQKVLIYLAFYLFLLFSLVATLLALM